jgi:hypothetical protein
MHVYPGLQPKHLASVAAKPRYNSFPPTSGPHYFRPAIWNFYDTPLPQVQLVHNLEHGGVVVQYGAGVAAGTVREIASWYAKHPNGLIIAPLPKLGKKVALAAWNAPAYKAGPRVDAGHGYLMRCNGFDSGAFDRFLRDRQFKGGERFLPSLLVPGS